MPENMILESNLIFGELLVRFCLMITYNHILLILDGNLQLPLLFSILLLEAIICLRSNEHDTYIFI